ncbi:F-box protein [Corchorus olitorius]|uniref:F-box protein n=1 Tax=Corchorus olitorius TaxID=93759 RepID=A0A1R3HXE8_9ROSI|nr:F-box protein [Corchorus olitorius]
MTIGTKRGDFTHIGKSTYVIDCQMEGIPRERQSRSEESPRLRCYEQSHKEREEINEDGTINQEISEENRARLRLSSDSVSASSRRYLFGVGKELMLVCLDDMGKMIDVFKCDFKGRKWVQIKSLEGKTLYLSRTTSLFLEEILDPKVKNTIQLSRFSNMHKDYGSNVSYCLESQRYQLYGNHAQALPDLSHTMEFHSGFWIQPLLLPQMIMNDV